MCTNFRFIRSSRAHTLFVALLLGFSFANIGWAKPTSSHTPGQNNPACQGGCVMVEQLGEYDVVTAVSPKPDAISQRVVRNGNKDERPAGIKCSLKSDCVIVDEPDFFDLRHDTGELRRGLWQRFVRHHCYLARSWHGSINHD